MAEAKLPSGKLITFEKYSTKQQRMMYKKLQQKKSDAGDLLMQHCIKTIDGEAVTAPKPILDLHSGDRIAATLHVRRLVHGPLVKFSFECRGCHVQNPRDGNKAMSASIDEVNWDVPLIMDCGPVTLPISGKKATWGLPTGHTEKLFVELGGGGATVDLCYMMLARGLKLDDVTMSDDAVDAMEPADSEFLIPFFNKIGGPDTRVDAECWSCGKAWKSPIERLPDFFYRAVSAMAE